MAHTVYATFNSERDAERAAGALMDHGVQAADVSFVMSDRVHMDLMDQTQQNVSAVLDPGTSYNASGQERDTLIAAALPGESAATVSTIPAPAMGQYAGQGPTIVPTGYSYDALGAIERDHIPGRAAVAEMASSSVGVPKSVNARTAMAADTPIDTVEADHGHIIDNNRAQSHAASGITTTTGKDAAKGAAEGAGIGLGLGIALGIAAVLVPGVGLVAGAGALIASLTAATAVAGGVAGGVYGYLADMGLPQETARLLDNHLEGGGLILSVNISDNMNSGEIVALMTKYGATSAQAF